MHLKCHLCMLKKKTLTFLLLLDPCNLNLIVNMSNNGAISTKLNDMQSLVPPAAILAES